MGLEDDVLAVIESAQDRRAAVGVVVRMVRAAVALEEAAERRQAEERVREERRERERVRKAEYRERLSRAVPGTDGDGAGQTGTKRDMVPPLDPPSSPVSLSLLPDPERAIPLLEFPVVGGGTGALWGLKEILRDKQQEAFPDLDVMAEYRKCLAWLEANPTRRKTARGMPAALFRWLTHAQEKGTGAKRQRPKELAASAKPSGLAAYCDWHQKAMNAGRPTRFPKDSCPDCKHLAAKASSRASDGPQAFGDLAGGGR